MQNKKISVRSFAILTTLALIVSRGAFASQSAGLPNAIFRAPAGAWASGMGGAVSADPEYMLAWYNPSSLPLLRERRASLGMGLRSLGRMESWASYDFRVPPRAGLGLALVYRGDPFVDDLYDGYYSESGGVVKERRLNDASWSAVSLKVGAGYLVSRRLTLGGSVAVNYQSLPTTPDEFGGEIYSSSITSIGAIDLAATYKMSHSLTLFAAVKNLFARNSWQIDTYYGMSPTIEEEMPTIFAFGSSHKIKLLERELIWNADAEIYLFDSDGGYIERPEMVVAAGARWKFSDAITLRAGVGEMEFSGDLWRDSESFFESFSPRIAAGFSYSLSKWIKGSAINYTLMTDRVWAAVDQQFDITVNF